MEGGVTETARERFSRTLKERADKITCVRNDIYTVKYYRLIINFVLGMSAVALLIVSMIADGKTVRPVCLICGIALVAVTVVYFLIMRAEAPMSYLQYTVVDGDSVYTFHVVKRDRAAFCDGENTVTLERGVIRDDLPLRLPQLRFDFFADMNVDLRIGKPDKEIFKGTLEENGKRYKCKIVFKSGMPTLGVVGGMRVRYFDINDKKEKFAVPGALRAAVEKMNVRWPKLNTVVAVDGFSKIEN